MLVNLLSHSLAEPAYEADVAQLEYKLVAGEHGLVLKIRGFNHKLSHVCGAAEEEDVRLLMLEESRWSVVDLYQALAAGLTPDQLMEFSRSFKAQLYVEGLVQGNVTSAYVTEVFQLPGQHHVCKVRSLNKGDANSEVTVYYQMHMEEPCFDFLRTKETLGYHVYPTCRNTSGILGFSVTVETQATKFSTETVELKIEEFLSSFGKKLSALGDHVTALVRLKEYEDTHLGEEVDRHWAEVVTQQYIYDRLICALKQMSREDLVSWYRELRAPDRPRLSVHMAAATAIMDIPAFTRTLTLLPYHK
ncbi:hypothetical protein NHX12_016882, partial [Muraenolepis orangiensis]